MVSLKVAFIMMHNGIDTGFPEILWHCDSNLMTVMSHLIQSVQVKS